jgi:hypothetical protein
MSDTLPDQYRPRSPIEQLLDDIKAAFAAAQRWVKEHESEIATAIEGMVIWSRISLHLSAVSRRYRDTEWEFLLDRVDFLAASSLLVALDRDGSNGVAGVLEQALGHRGALAPMLAALDTVDLPSPQRKQLQAGLEQVTLREYELAVPLLIAPFEGVVHNLALQREIIEPHKGKKHRFAEHADKDGPVGGIEDLLFEDLGFDGTFADFLRSHVYGGTGNAYRHGFATSGYRERALLLATALLGWLDAVAEPERRAEPLRHLLARVGTTLWVDLLTTATPSEPLSLVAARDGAASRLLLPPADRTHG